MADQEELGILMRGVQEWNDWRQKRSGQWNIRRYDLSGADLAGRRLREANLEGVDLEIERGIKHHNKLLVICSEHSLQSGPVLREIERAIQREDREGASILFPVTIDSYLFDVWGHPRKLDVLAKVVGDFRGWDRDDSTYAAAFQRVLDALQTKPEN